MARIVTGVDIGLRTAKFLRGSFKGNTFKVTDFAVEQVASKEITDGWGAIELDFKPQAARVGLTGKDVNIRYTRVPRVPDWQLRNLMRFEVAEIGDQSGSGLASDFNLLPQLPEIEGEDVVLLAMARESLLSAHEEGLAKLGGKLDAFTPNAIALYGAFLRYGVVQDETVLVANIGYDNLDVVVVRGPDLIFARNLTGGSRLFEEAIAQRFGISSEKACQIKETLATLEPGATFTDPNQEKASRAILGAAGQVLSLLQSTLLFCKSQVKISGLKLDRVLLCGGGAALRGLPKYLSSGLSVPVELFDPFRVVDVSALSPEKAALLEDHKLEAVVALGLATAASDPDAYSIEILSAKDKKRREFFGAQIYLWVAGLLALLYLGYDAWQTSSALRTTSELAKTLEQQYKRANQTHRKTEELLSESAKLGELASVLGAAKGSGEQLARVLYALESELPGDFWITQVSTDLRADPELGVERGAERPVLSIAGKAREGTSSLATQYEAFIQGLRRRLPQNIAVKERLAATGAKFTVDLTLFAPPKPTSEVAATDAPDGSTKGAGTKDAPTPPAPRGEAKR
jgi:Tfp pilus assembly PilM family ATPase